MRRLTITTLLLLALASPAHAAPVGLNARVLTKAQTRSIVREACRAYHVPSTWLVPAIIDIAYTGVHPNILDRLERRESDGDCHASNGPCQGFGQFFHDPVTSKGWHQNAADRRRAIREGHKHDRHGWRHCGRCVIYRMVRCYRDGGKPAIRRHWRATLYR